MSSTTIKYDPLTVMLDAFIKSIGETANARKQDEPTLSHAWFQAATGRHNDAVVPYR